jgi:hypothetical protein
MSTQCLKCGYSVTEPICAPCIVREINIWSREKKIKKYTIRHINFQFKALLASNDSLDYVSTESTDVWGLSVKECIICKREMHLMCKNCVIHQASKIVLGSLKSQGVIQSFHESFNTSLYDSGSDKNDLL